MRIRLLLVVVLGLLPFARATSVIPPTFPELVAEADSIYRARVDAIEARRVAAPDGDQVIKTFVTFAVERVLKGAEKTEVVLEFLGGTVGDETLTVTGMPKFNLGDREIVFVQKNGLQFCPLVGVMHGRYRVLRDEQTKRDFVARDNRAPLADVADVELPMQDVPAPLREAAKARALAPADFEANIVSEIRRPSRRTLLR
jgi:hypothetical protein